MLKFYACGAQAPKKLVIVLHGLGADGQDLLGLGQEWAPLLPHVKFISPDAPFDCDMAPYGYQWFSLQDRDPHAIQQGIEAVAPKLNAFIDEQLKAHGLNEGDLVLSGFSQGAMMSLYVGLRRKLAGILAYSGGLFGFEAAACQKIPVCLVHGDADMVVPVQAFDAAKETLEQAGFTPETHRLTGLGHGIDARGLTLGSQFIKKVL